MKKNTGLMLSEVQGPLKNLLDNLSGEYGNYWLKALKKMLRREEIPNPPEDLSKLINAFNSKEAAKEKLQKLVDYLKTIPMIDYVTICEEEEEGDILNINIFPNLMTFLYGAENLDTPLLILKPDHSVICCFQNFELYTDKTFNDFFSNKKKFENITEFCKAMIELGKKYEETVPAVPKI